MRRELRIRIRHDDHVILGSAERLHTLAVARSGFIDMLSDRSRTNEAHRGDTRVGEQRVDGLTVAVDHVEYACGQARFAQQLGEPQTAGRILLRRLQHERVAARKRNRKHPQRDHGGEVEWRNARADTDGLSQRPAVDACADAVRKFALEQMRNAARELHDLQPAGHLTARIREHFAVLAGNQRSELIDMRVEQCLEPEHDARALQRRRLCPAR